MWLQVVLLLDSAALVALGGSLILVPGQVAEIYGFGDLPVVVHHLLALWGCALLTLGFGYFVAATNPRRHVVMVQMGIARGVLELLLGVAHVALGVVSLTQATTGMIAGTSVAVAYIVLYPRAPVLPPPAVAAEESEESAADTPPEPGSG